MRLIGSLLMVGDMAVGYKHRCPICNKEVSVSVEDPALFYLFHAPVLTTCEHLLCIEGEAKADNSMLPIFVYQDLHGTAI